MVNGDIAQLEEIVRWAHLSILGLCFFLVVFADLTAANSVFRPLYKGEFARLRSLHAALSAGLIVLWLTGLFLIWRGTGFDVAQFSPKLIAKITVVSLLTLNAFAIGQIALPFFERNREMMFGEFDISVRLRLTCLGAVSSASWISAFCLGAIPSLKTASTIELVHFLAPIYSVFFTLALLLSLISSSRSEKPEIQPFASSRSLSKRSVLPAE